MLAGLLVAAARRAQAGDADYLAGTLAWTVLAPREAELNLTAEAHRHERRRGPDAVGAELDLGVVHRVMVEAGAAWQPGDRVREEELAVRAALATQRGWRPAIGLAVACQAERERANPVLDTAVEPRLVLESMIGRMQLTGNAAIELGESGSRGAWAVAGRWPADRQLRGGIEVQRPAQAQHVNVTPQVWWLLPHELSLKAGVGFGLARRADPTTARLALELE